jgi:probable DNA repair protein
MYDWLKDALDESTCVVTANRRLAHELHDAWSAHQVASGAGAWRTPPIQPWSTWLGIVLAGSRVQDAAPTRINAHQSQVLWERCLRKELGDDAIGLPSLVRIARDTWQRLADACVSIREVARTAQSEDQRLYAAAAGRYQAILENEHWVDDAGLAGEALGLIRARQIKLASRYVFAGFDRERAAVTAMQEALRSVGCEVIVQEAVDRAGQPMLHEFEERDTELRCAGAWARQRIDAQPDAMVAIVVHGLEQTATRDLRLVREGFVPGWQYGSISLRNAVNVSYGRRLVEYPATTIGLLALRWLAHDLSSTEVSRLLQSPLLGRGELDGRSRLELRLRELPDRAWAPSMVTTVLRGAGADAEDWLSRIAAFSKRRRELPARASPATWVMLFDETLQDLGWPGAGTLSSNDYQLINRWRELLNDLARLELVSPSMTSVAALGHLERMAAETVFQPENRQARVQLIGPLEAAGGEFDAIWVAGVTANNWPPPGNPSPLVSRVLQVERGMPDATPDDTRAWARTTLLRLTGSAPDVVCSYALVEDDVEQTVSDLLADLDLVSCPPDPGWHASKLTSTSQVRVAGDSVPRVCEEKIYGGAATIQRQMSEPFSAFAYGRLGIRGIDPQALGVPALLRGNVVHDTLYRLYQDLPSAEELRGWSDAELRSAILAAADGALQKHLRLSGPVLQQLLRLERNRVIEVVTRFVRMDAARGDFTIAALEGELELQHDTLALKLRFDRIDRYDDGSIAILDYKTGAAKQLLLRDGSVKEPQLFVYAAATDELVAMLALANLDSREVGFSGAGRGFTDEDSWPELLDAVRSEINVACDDLIAGDVRIVAEQGAGKARRLNVLSRYTELHRDR